MGLGVCSCRYEVMERAHDLYNESLAGCECTSGLIYYEQAGVQVSN